MANTPKRLAKPSEKTEFIPPCEALLTRKRIAILLGITPRTLDKMIGAGEYPRCDFRLRDKEHGDPRWRTATHDAWVRRQAGIEE